MRTKYDVVRLLNENRIIKYDEKYTYHFLRMFHLKASYLLIVSKERYYKIRKIGYDVFTISLDKMHLIAKEIY